MNELWQGMKGNKNSMFNNTMTHCLLLLRMNMSARNSKHISSSINATFFCCFKISFSLQAGNEENQLRKCIKWILTRTPSTKSRQRNRRRLFLQRLETRINAKETLRGSYDWFVIIITNEVSSSISCEIVTNVLIYSTCFIQFYLLVNVKKSDDQWFIQVVPLCISGHK